MPTTNYILTSKGGFISEDELYHYGVKGMKWGVRRYQNPDGSLTNSGKKHRFNDKQSYIDRKTAKLQNDIDSKKKQKAKLEAKLSRKWDIRATANKLENEASLKDRILYNSGTRTKAAKYIVDNNMPVAEATKKAKNEALRNAAILCTAYGAITVASLYKNLNG